LQTEISTTNLPSVESTTKPWTRWWWLGNAVDESSIDTTLEAFAQAGLGGVEIANIYGAKGAEDKFIDHLSPEWIEKVNHTLNTAKRLGLEVDLTLGTGWPFGGPQVELEYAATKMRVKTIDVKQGEAINHKVELINEKVNAPLACVAAVAFDTSGKFQDLTKAIKNNNLSRAAQNKAYKLYLVYADKTAQKVKRASPGGAGWTLDHFSTAALKDYLEPYNTAFTSLDHAIAVYSTTVTRCMELILALSSLMHFKQKRGYDLKPHIEKLYK
jgi:hypothetical protein